MFPPSSVKMSKVQSFSSVRALKAAKWKRPCSATDTQLHAVSQLKHDSLKNQEVIRLRGESDKTGKVQKCASFDIQVSINEHSDWTPTRNTKDGKR
jgi:hypothetical protein